MLARVHSSLGASCSGRVNTSPYTRPVFSSPLGNDILIATTQQFNLSHISFGQGCHSSLQPQRLPLTVLCAAAADPPQEAGSSDDEPDLEIMLPDDEDEDEEADEDEAFPTIQLNLPPPVNVKVKTAEYLSSNVKVADCPPPRYAEFAVIGRSNVGKSSLINLITGRKDLALVSKQPGKTKCINHFIINESWYLVDLPGYGFAKVGQQGRDTFDKFTREYFKHRLNLAMVFLLIDGSIPPQKIDLAYANWLTDSEVPFVIVFTKVDKKRKGAEKATVNVDRFKRALLQDLAYLPPCIVTSSAAGIGKGELLRMMASLRIAFEKSGRLQAIRQGAITMPTASELEAAAAAAAAGAGAGQEASNGGSDDGPVSGAAGSGPAKAATPPAAEAPAPAGSRAPGSSSKQTSGKPSSGASKPAGQKAGQQRPGQKPGPAKSSSKAGAKPGARPSAKPTQKPTSK